MRANVNHPISAPRECECGSGEKTWGENERWDHSCGKDKRDNLPFVFKAGSIDFGALFGGRRPGTGTDTNHSSFPVCASFNFRA